MEILYWFKKKTQKKPSHSTRFIELDILRGLAIFFMIGLHILWDLDYFHILPLNTSLYRFNLFVPVMFFLLVGICLAVNDNRNQHSIKKSRYSHTIQRGLWIFILGMILTLISSLILPERPIVFGVLHCIGLSIIISLPFLRFKTYNLVFAFGFIGLGLLFGTVTFTNPTILQMALGLHQADVWRYTIDYFPLLPWIGVTLLGVTLGNILYKGNERRFTFPELSHYRPVKAFSWLGQHSLIIYLIHQPLITAALLVFIMK